MKKRVIMGLLAAGVTTTAWAGTKGTYPVNINLTSGEASGSMGSARNSTDTKQFIGCVLTGYSGTQVSVQCYAQDAVGNYATCSSVDSGYVTAMSAITDGAYLHFAWDSAGNCTYLRVYSSSLFPPPQP